MWPKNAAPPGVLAPSRSKSHRVPGSLAQGFSPAGEPQCLALTLPSRLLQQKQRDWASRRSLPLPVQPPRHACDYSGQAAFMRSEGSHPHKGALCLCFPGPAAGAPGSAPRQGRKGAPPPQSRDRHPQPSPSTGRPSLLPGFKIGLPLACHNPHLRKQAQELGAHRPLRRSERCHRAALSTLLACRSG